jgi:UDP-N-acetylglucosamine 1-carboxyvinyltransferase
MDSILVRGNGVLNGQIPIAGAKNACLTLMPATLLTDQPLTLTNAPRLSDIRTMTQLLQSLGAEVRRCRAGRCWRCRRMRDQPARRTMTSCARCAPRSWCWGRCWRGMGMRVVSLPGGCAIGARPVDLHLKALEAMGAELDLRDGYVHATRPGGCAGR